MKLRHVVSVLLMPSGLLPAEEIDLLPFLPASHWQPVPNEVLAGRSEDQIVLRSSSEKLLGVSQDCLTDGPGVMVRIDAITGPPGSQAAVSLHDRVEVPYIAGATLLVDTDGKIGLNYESWEPSRATIPEDRMTFPFWVQISWDGGGFGCYLSQDKITWKPVVLFPITFPPASYDLMVQSSESGAEACATFSEVTLLGADANDNGITDGWEVFNFEQVLPGETPDDPDQDGRTNYQEWLDRTAPNVPDHPATLELTQIGEQFYLSLSKAIFSDLKLQMSRDLETWEIVSHTKFDLNQSYARDTSTFVIEMSEQLGPFFRTKFSPEPDRDPSQLFPAIWE